MKEIIETVHALIEKQTTATAAMAALKSYVDNDLCDGYWHGQAGMELAQQKRQLALGE